MAGVEEGGLIHVSRMRPQRYQALETSVSRDALRGESHVAAPESQGNYGHTWNLKSEQCYSGAKRDPLEALPGH